MLTDLGLPQDALLLSLVSFNIGVEVGQLAIVIAFLPLAYLIRRSWSYPRLVLTGGSVAVIVIALIWFTERAFDFRLFPLQQHSPSNHNFRLGCLEESSIAATSCKVPEQ